MRIDRVKLIAEMARRDMKVQELADKATVSRATVTALRGGKSCNENSIRISNKIVQHQSIKQPCIPPEIHDNTSKRM